MRRSAAWRAAVVVLAESFSDGGSAMGMQYCGGPVTGRHVALWFTPERPETTQLFNTAEPSREQFAAMARDVTAAMNVEQAAGSAYDTNLAAEFYVLSCLYRLGYSANLTLGNKKAVDVFVAFPDGQSATIDVKGLAGSTGWPVDNVRAARSRHFLVFVSYRDLIMDPREEPELYVVPSSDFAEVVYQAPGGRKLVRLSTLRDRWQQYEHAWHQLRPTPHE